MEMTYDYIIGLQFERFGLQTLIAKPLVVDECTVRTFEISDVNLGTAGYPRAPE